MAGGGGIRSGIGDSTKEGTRRVPLVFPVVGEEKFRGFEATAGVVGVVGMFDEIRLFFGMQRVLFLGSGGSLAIFGDFKGVGTATSSAVSFIGVDTFRLE